MKYTYSSKFSIGQSTNKMSLFTSSKVVFLLIYFTFSWIFSLEIKEKLYSPNEYGWYCICRNLCFIKNFWFKSIETCSTTGLNIYLCLTPVRIWDKVFFIVGIWEDGGHACVLTCVLLVNTSHRFTRLKGQMQCEQCWSLVRWPCWLWIH